MHALAIDAINIKNRISHLVWCGIHFLPAFLIRMDVFKYQNSLFWSKYAHTLSILLPHHVSSTLQPVGQLPPFFVPSGQGLRALSVPLSPPPASSAAPESMEWMNQRGTCWLHFHILHAHFHGIKEIKYTECYVVDNNETNDSVNNRFYPSFDDFDEINASYFFRSGIA